MVRFQKKPRVVFPDHLNYKIGYSKNGLILFTENGKNNSNKIQAKYFKWDEIGKISDSHSITGWGYVSTNDLKSIHHLPQIIGNGCIILKNGEKHNLGFIDNTNLDILLTNFENDPILK